MSTDLQRIMKEFCLQSRSQTKIFKGVKIAKNNCNPHAFGVFRIIVKIGNSNGFSKKWLSLPNKRPNEF